MIDADRLLVTEKEGSLKLVHADGRTVEVTGVPEVAYGGQGGLGDIVLAPDFAESGTVYLSYVEADGKLSGAAAAMARLEIAVTAPHSGTCRSSGVRSPRSVAGATMDTAWLSGPRASSGSVRESARKFDPAQDMEVNLGKVLRLNPDGSVPDDNPHAGRDGVAAQVWSSGHRNPLGLAFDGAGKLWVVEMGPAGGDELNRVRKGANYGYPFVSDGDHYDGREIPDHSTQPRFQAPAISWNPAISPSSLMFYHGPCSRNGAAEP